MNEIVINNNGGELTVSSVQVAKDFGKEHKNVIQAIENIKAENSAVTSMFIESAYQAGTGKSYKSYEITRDGFSLLVMGFTGKKALDWKLKYIEAFNTMERHINETIMERALKIADEKVKLLELERINAPISQKQIDELNREADIKAIDLCKSGKVYFKVGKAIKLAIWDKICERFSVSYIGDITVSQFDEAVNICRNFSDFTIRKSIEDTKKELRNYK